MMLKRFVKNIILLFVALWAVSLVISYLLPFYWSDSTQALKYEFYKKNKQNYNAVYLGGSLEFRHLDPAIIDSMCRLKNINLHSINLAVDGHNIVQEMTDLEGLLAIDNPNLKYIFLSLSSEPYFFKNNIHTSKWVSWQSAKSTYRAITIISTLGDDKKLEAQYSMYYAMSWMENFYKIGIMTNVFDYYKNKLHPDMDYLGPRRNGFYPYDLEANHLLVDDPNNDKLIRFSKQDYLSNKPKRDSLLAEIDKSFSTFKGDEKPNEAQLKLMMDAYKKCAKKKIQLIFMLPPKARTNYSYLLPIYNALPEGARISIADPRKFPELYQVENGYNFHHLNYKGAKLASYSFGQQLAELLQPHP